MSASGVIPSSFQDSNNRKPQGHWQLLVSPPGGDLFRQEACGPQLQVLPSLVHLAGSPPQKAKITAVLKETVDVQPDKTLKKTKLTGEETGWKTLKILKSRPRPIILLPSCFFLLVGGILHTVMATTAAVLSVSSRISSSLQSGD